MKTLFVFSYLLLVLQANATDFYVSSTGNDSNSGTDAASPWQSISKVNSKVFSTGDRILFKRGDSWYGKTLSNKYSGITFGAYGSGENPLIDGNGGYAMTSFLSRKDVVVDGLSFKMSGKSGYIVWFDSSYNFKIKNCKFFGGVVLRGTYNLFENNIVDGATNNGDGNGVWEAFETSHHNTYRGNTVRNFSYRGFWTMTKTHHSVYENNIIHDIGNCGIDIDGAFTVSYNHTIKGNTLYNIDNSSIELENGFNNTVINNYMYDGGRTYLFAINYDKGDVQNGVGSYSPIGAVTNNLFANNIMVGGGHASTKGGVIMAMGVQSAGGVKFYNNSVYNFNGDYFFLLYNQKSDVKETRLVNNILYNATNPNSRLVVFAKSDYDVLAEDDYNCLYNAVSSYVYHGNISLAKYQSLSGKASHSIYANPLFLNLTKLPLQSISPAIDAGKDVGFSYNGSAPDMGANEFLGATNNAPVANAGPDQTITLPKNSVSLSGSGKDSDGTIASYLWTKISGPSSFKIVSTASAATDVTGLVEGIYQFQLEVKDDKGSSAKSSVTITVNPAINQAPVANAGSDQTITLPKNSVYLSGSGTDSDGTIASYLWTKISGPSSFKIVSATSAATDVTGLVEGIYQFQLEVKDDKGSSAKSSVTITVNPAINQAPVANAGSDQTITLPKNSVSLSGSGKDSDGTIASYLWTKISGPSSFKIVSAASAATDVTGLIEGIYQFQLEVKDDKGSSAKSSVTVTVNPAINQAPVANAGSDQTITLPKNSVSLSGSGTDADGTIASYSWKKIAGPSSFKIVSAASAATDVTDLVEGIYQFQLEVKDDKGSSAKSSVTITVNPAINQAPVANAGSDQTITLPKNSVPLSGSGKDSDGTIASYLWTKISGPSSFKIVSAASAATDVTDLVEGIYQFQLEVKDDKGSSAKSSVTITVNPAINQAPVANAGSDQTITLPKNSVSLSGSGTDADGTIASYLWKKIAGPSSFKIVSTASAATDVTDLVEGIYQFQLEVKDDKGSSAKSSVTITVNPAINQAPVANAGSDQTITLPKNSVYLSGSGTDSDGTIASYLWTKISGPSAFKIVSATSAGTDITDLIEGIYQFQLEVKDDKGSSAKSSVTITVNSATNQAPVANAGSDQTITLPKNSVYLSGSGTDSDGTIASYLWTKISGPSSFKIVSAASAATDVTDLVEGIYQFQLVVKDDKGSSAKSSVNITVNPATNQAPVANAGSDQTITLPKNSVSLSGSGTDSDGTIASYLWTKISGPSSFKISSPSASKTNVTNLVEGKYIFELKVLDNNGFSAKDSITITVNPKPVKNAAPVANAGADQTIALPKNNISLSGSGKDPDGTIASYSWTKISGPSSFNVSNSSDSITVVTNLVEGKYIFELTVLDNNGVAAKDSVVITVNPESAKNAAPVANAGSDQTITLPKNNVSLSGSGTDSDGTIASYSWTKISGPSSFKIVSASSAGTDVTGLVEGKYIFELKVLDNNGVATKDSVAITVNPESAKNAAPVANAGSDQTITLPKNSVSLSGSGTDSDGTIASYSWTKISGPSSFNVSNSPDSITVVTNLVEGKYIFELTVLDNNGVAAKDSVAITVNPESAKNAAPVANAGSDQTITLPKNSVSLSGSGKDSDGTIASYSWTKISGPSSYKIVTATSAGTDVIGLVEGKYIFELRVLDNNGVAAKDSVVITVNPIMNISITTLVADAGNDTTIVSPNNSVTLHGKANGTEGISVSWKQIAGTTSTNILSSASLTSDVRGLKEGTYQFELNVTSKSGAQAKDTVSVTVALGRLMPNTSRLKIYPNPVRDIATLEVTTENNNTNLLIVISDLTGKTVYQKQSVSVAKNITEKIDMSNLIKGIYLVTVYFDGQQKQSLKVIRL